MKTKHQQPPAVLSTHEAHGRILDAMTGMQALIEDLDAMHWDLYDLLNSLYRKTPAAAAISTEERAS